MSEHRQRRFCVVTTGRAGSTSLMDTLAAHQDIAVPARQLACVDHELLHPDNASGYAAAYSRLSGRPVGDEAALIEAFFALNAKAPWAGFKTMPNRHRDPQSFFARDDIRFIVLLRDDLVATAASFLLARTRGTWRRQGGTPSERITFSREHWQMLLGNLVYLHQSQRRLRGLEGVIRLRYEDLCAADFHNPELDAFFERSVRIANPSPPTRADSYVSNADELANFVGRAWERLEQRSRSR